MADEYDRHGESSKDHQDRTRARGRSSITPHSGENSRSSDSPHEEPGTSRGYNGTARGTQKRRRSGSMESNAQSASKRGAHQKTRGRVLKLDIIRTIPEHIVESGKCGSGGTQVALHANYFQLVTIAHWHLYAYHVTFEPDIEIRQIKTRLLKEFGKGIPEKHFFDGSIIRTAEKMAENIMTFTGTTREEEEIKITVKFVKEETNLDSTFHQHLNLILRLAMKQLNLQQVGRHLYDPRASRHIQELQLELWPGYSTSIRMHDSGLLMNADVITKVMRKETLHQILKNAYNQKDHKGAFTKDVMGTVVLTDYNNQTYQILDIDWNQTPKSTFDTKNGPETYIDYYRKVSRTVFPLRFHLSINACYTIRYSNNEVENDRAQWK